jgi:hypothetical protein
MASAWTEKEKKIFKKGLHDLYVVKNLTINEVGNILGIAPQTVFKRLKILGIKTCSEKKTGYQNKRVDVCIPKKRTKKLAEFFGIMIGDGHLSKNQVMVTLGSKEGSYVEYVSELMSDIFKMKVNVSTREAGYKDVYISSVDLSRWLIEEGLVFNKVKSQVGVPKWVLQKDEFMISFLRGFFDTDGSVYKLRYGIQVSYTNRSLPLLEATRYMLRKLGYSPSKESIFKVYLTRRPDLEKFFSEIRPAHKLRVGRYEKFVSMIMRRSDSGYSSRL